MISTRRGVLAGVGGLVAAPAIGQTARYPERPIEVVVGFTAGGGTDLDARSYARALEQRIGGTVVISNRPGAGGELALGAVARARPDGHTLGTTNMPSFVTIPIERQAQFKLDDFAPIANLVTDPSAITGHAEGPFQSLAQVIERARAAPDTITFASPGIGTDDHLQLVLLQEAAGVRLNHVAFQGDPQLRTALLGRQVDLIGPQPRRRHGGAAEHAGACRRAGRGRSRFRPDVPTCASWGSGGDGLGARRDRARGHPAGHTRAAARSDGGHRARPGVRPRARSALHGAGLRAGRRLVRAAAAGGGEVPRVVAAHALGAAVTPRRYAARQFRRLSSQSR
jgi:tripartite-type tricarboxylate transporter receptor subunit TctC